MRHATEQAAATALQAGDAIIVRQARGACEAPRAFFLHAASLATPPVVNTTILWGRGLTCFSVTPSRALSLGLLRAGERQAGAPQFLRSVEAADCTGTGISAADRARTLRAAGDEAAGLASLRSPGHVIPALADGEDPAATAEVALAVLRRLTTLDVPAWTDILDDDGNLADPDHVAALAARLALPSIEA